MSLINMQIGFSPKFFNFLVEWSYINAINGSVQVNILNVNLVTSLFRDKNPITPKIRVIITEMI